MSDGWEARDEQLEGFLRQVKALECDLRLERQVVEQLRRELVEQGQELVRARTDALRWARAAEEAQERLARLAAAKLVGLA